MKATVFHRSEHLDEHQLLEENPSCPFCASTDRLPIGVLQKSPEVLLLRCRHCLAASASRMPTHETLTGYYGHYYDDAQSEKVTADMPDKIAAHIFRCSKPYLADSYASEIAILDYGGGDGSISTRIADFLIADGAEAVLIRLIDYDQTVRETRDKRVKIVRANDLSEVPEQTVDLVIASAIIEHLPEPRSVLAGLLSSLKAGGVFYARTPYVFPLMKVARALNLHFDFTYPAHLHDLGAGFWNGIIDRLPVKGEFRILRSTPSIVETRLKRHFVRTLAASLLKIPGYLFKESYGLVGGWEIFVRRLSCEKPG